VNLELGNLEVTSYYTVAGLSYVPCRVSVPLQRRTHRTGFIIAGWVEFYYFFFCLSPVTVQYARTFHRYLLTCITDPIKPHEDPPDDDGCYYLLYYYMRVVQWCGPDVDELVYIILCTRVKGTRGTCPELVSVFTWQ